MNEAITPSGKMVETRTPVREFAMRFTATPRGARLSRRLVSLRLHEWGHPWASDTNDALSLIAAELTANAVRHGRVPGRDFHVRLTEAGGILRIEVTDTRGERCPSPGDLREPACDEESGRGLLLVSRLARRWGVLPRSGAPGKTVWAEVRGEKSPPGTV